MGAKYAIAAQRVALGKLRPSTRKVLIVMALRVLDKKTQDREPGVYYWGYHRILGDMGIMPTKSSLRELKRNISELARLGLVVQRDRAYRGHGGQWALHLAVDNPGSKHPGADPPHP
jgi:hypothetical protein